MEEIMKHRGHKEREQHHSHHHTNLFHLPGHHHKDHQQQQQTGTFETYREVSSALDEPSNTAQSSGSCLKLTVGRIV